MRRTITKFVSVLLAAAMFTLVTSGCQSAGTSTATSSAGSGSDSKTTVKYDFKGRTITLGHWFDQTPSQDSNKYALEVARINQIQKDYNCKIKWVFTNDFNTWCDHIVVMALSNEKVADAFFAPFDQLVPQWVNSQLIAPIDDDFDWNDKVWNQNIDSFWSMNGKHYGITDWQKDMGWVIFFNKKLCAQNGISDTTLYSLEKSGQWTWDKLEQYAKQCTKMDSNGSAVSWGLGSATAGPVGPEALIYTNGDKPVKISPDKKYTYNLDDPAILETLDWCNKLVWDDKVAYATKNSGIWSRLFKQGKIAFYEVPSWSCTDLYQPLKQDQYGILLLPKGPKATKYVNPMSSYSGWFIQPMVQDKKGIGMLVTDYVKYMSIHNPKEANQPLSVKWKNYLFDKGSAETLDMINTDQVESVELLGCGPRWFRNNVLWSDWGINSKIPARTFVNAMRASSQKSFDDLWNNAPSKPANTK